MQATKDYYAIIDIGSNSIRLVIYSKEDNMQIQEVENVKTMAKLRNDLDKNNMLREEGIQKLVETLKSFHEVTKTYHLTAFFCVATATIRKAKNQQEIIDRVYKATNWELVILSEEDEAYYGYLAVVHTTNIDHGITIDIGGGSIEVTSFEDRKLIHSHSFPFGALTLKEFFKKERPTRKEINQLRTYLKKQFRKLKWLEKKKVPLLAIGGSARNLVEIHQNFLNYPIAGLHQYIMTKKEIEKTSYTLSRYNEKELEQVEGLSKDRVDTIIPASFVFLTLYETIDAKAFILSRKGLRDGFLYHYLADNNQEMPDVINHSILELIYEYKLDIKQIDHVASLAKKLFKLFIKHDIGGFDEADWSYLRLGASVYQLGDYVDSESSSQHTFYLLANRTINGMMHRDRVRIALLASFKNKTVFKQYLTPFTNWFTKQEVHKLYILGALLKFAYCLDVTKRQVVQEMKFNVSSSTIAITISCNQDYMLEAYQTEKQKKHLEKAIGKTIEVNFKLS
jgi:exopolyphosphatase/guanosine-5'-triphosphate,3'-diphosphate pyrophosphatase